MEPERAGDVAAAREAGISLLARRDFASGELRARLEQRGYHGPVAAVAVAELLEQRVLNDPRVDIYPGGMNDIKTHQIDRRVLATLEFLAESGLKPSVSALKSGHSERTKSGNISASTSSTRSAKMRQSLAWPTA